jgi:beta-mannan synthase
MYSGDQFAPIILSEFHLSRVWREIGRAVQWKIATEQLLYVWNPIRSLLIVPLLQFAIVVCVSMTVMILLEKLFVGLVSLAVKIFNLKPEKRYKWEPIKQDEELGSSVYPMVLVQIPMYNEKEVHNAEQKYCQYLFWKVYIIG